MNDLFVIFKNMHNFVYSFIFEFSLNLYCKLVKDLCCFPIRFIRYMWMLVAHTCDPNYLVWGRLQFKDSLGKKFKTPHLNQQLSAGTCTCHPKLQWRLWLGRIAVSRHLGWDERNIPEIPFQQKKAMHSCACLPSQWWQEA
jgi:hypothetical protein